VRWCVLTVVASILPLTGATCPPKDGITPEGERLQQIQRLQDELEQCQRAKAAGDDSLFELQQQIERLNETRLGKAFDVLPRVQRIEPAPLSGGYDENNDGIDEGVVVYLSCVDEDGDAVKAMGRVQVQLFDLSAASERVSVGEVDLPPKELRKNWYGRVASQHYAIKCPWANEAKRPPAKSITAKVTFIEYLTGRVLEWQGAFDVAGFGPTTTMPAPSAAVAEP